MLPPDYDRRIWLFVDETHSLQKMPKLATAMARGRKYGICEVIGFQNVAQPRETYGRDGAEALLGLPQTIFLGRLPDPDTSKWASGVIAERHIIRGVEGESTSANGGGESTTYQHSTEAAIMPAQIQTLPNMEGILRYMGTGGSGPEMKTARIRLTRKDRASNNTPGYVPAEADPGVLGGLAGRQSSGRPVPAEDAPTVSGAGEFKTAVEIEEEVAEHDPFAM